MKKQILRLAAAANLALGCLVLFVSTANARTAQVCPGPALPPEGCFTIDTSIIGGRAFEDYVVTRPGTLLFESGARKGQLKGLTPDTVAQYCAVNPGAATKNGLPTVSFTAAKVIINASIFQENGQTRIDDVASVVFTNIHSSEGLSFPTLALNFARQRGTTRVGLEFRPALGSNVTEIPGLTADWFFVDIATGETQFPRLGGTPEPLRRLMRAIAYRLPSIFSAATEIVVIPGAADPQWTMSDIGTNATQFSALAFATPQPVFPPIVTLTCDLGPGATTCVELPELWAFRDYFARYGADYLSNADPATASGLLANLHNWASANALSIFTGIQIGEPNQPDFRPKYEVQRLLLPMITTWSLLRQDSLVTAEERALIDAWIGRVEAYATEPFGGAQNDYNAFNVGYLTLGVRMAWGIITGSNTAVGEGVERIYMGLYQMRSDGSFPRETARGACALNYQNLQTLSLLFLAELAAHQGYDAYALNVDGKTLHTAVKFILDAVDDPTVIEGYATEDPTNCTLPQGSPLNFDFTVKTDRDGQTYSAWVEPYLAKFSNHPNAARVANLLQGGLEANRSVFEQLSGGNTTCFYAEAIFADGFE